jgi:phytoene dehydrogenase-like protein
LLSRQGFSTLLLERAGTLGGRARTFSYFGFKVDNGAHVVATPDKNSVSNVLENAQADVELVPNPGRMLMFYDWKNARFGDLMTCGLRDCNEDEKAEFKRMFDMLKSTSIEEINSRYGRMNLQEWAEQNLRFPNLLKKMFVMAFEDHSKIAAPVVLRYYHNIFTSSMGMSYPKGGIQEIPDSLARVISAQGGAVMTHATCKQVILKDGAVKGVEFQIAPQSASYSQTVQVETDLVVCTLAAEQLFNVIDKGACEKEFVAQIEKISRIPAQQTCGVVAAVKADTLQPANFITGIAPMEKRRKPRIVFVPSVGDTDVAPHGYHVLYYDTTDFDPGMAINKERMYEEMMQELQAMYPRIAFKWAHLYISSSRTPSYSVDVTDLAAPDVRTDVKGLYFAGPQFQGMRDTGPIGIGRTMSSVRRCYDVILQHRALPETVSRAT